MSGLVTSCIAAPMMACASVARTNGRVMSTAGNAWRSASTESLNSGNVIDVLSDLFILRGVPSFIRSDNGPDFVAQAVQDWIKAVGAKTAYPKPLTQNRLHRTVRRGIDPPDQVLILLTPGRPGSRALSDQWRPHAHCESFNARFRDEFLNGEIFFSLRKVKS